MVTILFAILLWLSLVHKFSKPSLLYRATRDGWDASVFHSKCDNKRSTITVIKTDKGYVFGGYLDKGWETGFWITSNAAFLFSLKCHANMPPTKMSIKNSTNAAYCSSGYGPIFGDGHNIHISSNSNANTTSYSKIGTTYNMPEGISDPYFLNGQTNFKVSEIEIFQLCTIKSNTLDEDLDNLSAGAIFEEMHEISEY